MTSYDTQTGDGKFSIQFETDNRDHYERVQETIRECIDGESKVEPLPCPFCGEFPMVGSYPGSVDTQHRVWCGNTDCPAGAVYTESYTSKEDAIEKWNRRADR